MPEDWEPPVGVMSLSPNGVTVHCLDVPANAPLEDRTVGGFEYKVVYTKADAKTYAATACTSNLTDMSSMAFGGSLNEDISHWDVGNVTNMYAMFSNSAFNQDIGNWDVSNVTVMGYMFRESVYNKDIGSWDVGNVSDVSYMFYGSSAFNQNLSNWCVSSITSAPSTFNTNASSWTKPRPVWGSCP